MTVQELIDKLKEFPWRIGLVMNRLIDYIEEYSTIFMFVFFCFLGTSAVIGILISYHESLKNNPPVILGNKKLICEVERIK